MKIENIKEFLKRAKGLKLSEEQGRVLGYFEEFVELQQLGSQIGFDDQELKQKIIQSHRRFWVAFTQMAAKQGIPADKLKEKLLEAHRFRQDSMSSVAEKPTKVKRLSRNKNKLKA